MLYILVQEIISGKTTEPITKNKRKRLTHKSEEKSTQKKIKQCYHV